jgi:hypothetical protein
MEPLILFSDSLFSGDFLESKIFYTILALVVFWLIRRISLIVLLRGRDVQVQYRIRKSVAYITFPLAFLVIGRIWFAGFQAVSTYLGCRLHWSISPGGPSYSGDSLSRLATESSLATIVEMSLTNVSLCSV